MRLFCFGTLMDADIRRIVLGPGADRLRVRPAVLPGYRRVRVASESYPAVVPDAEAAVEGLLIEPVTARERARVQFFEGFEFALETRTVLVGSDRLDALACMATERLEADADTWSFAGWQRHDKPGYLEAAATYMAEFERLDVEEAHAVWIAERDGRTD